MLTYTLRVLNQVILGSIKKVPITSPYSVAFRCWPIDIDIFMHLNNASYFRVAELARWRMFPQSNMKKLSGTMFLVVKQDIKYIRPILPFQNYVVNTKLTVSEDKWLIHEHVFQQHPDDVKKDQKPVVYAAVNATAVVKEKSGKTVKASTLVENSEYYRKMVELSAHNNHHHDQNPEQTTK